MFVRVERALCVSLVAIGAFLAGVPAARGQQFSAAIVMQHDAKAVPDGQLRVFDGKLRMELPEFADGFFLVDEATPSAYFVRPGARIYMDARQSSRLTRLLIPVDPDQPCRQWQSMAHVAGLADQGDWHCERSGEEVVEGRKAIVFHVSSGPHPEFVGWIDPIRKFPLRIRTSEGTCIALENIRDAAQPASLFLLPPGLRKFSPEALVEQIKQSDVWVGEQIDDQSAYR